MTFAVNRLLRDRRGTSAIEFAIVGPVFMMMIIGMIYVSLMLFSMGSMQYAVEAGARCASVQTAVCTDNASTATYAQGAYLGPVIAPTFTAASATCGHSVTGSASFHLYLGITTLTVPLQATSCFP